MSKYLDGRMYEIIERDSTGVARYVTDGGREMIWVAALGEYIPA